MFPHKIVSGGQMGVDRAALDVALELGIPIGGYLPKGRKDENGDVLPEDKYANMQETDTDDVNVRTELNVQNSDATLIFSHGALFGGSEYTERMARKHGKPCLHVDFDTARCRSGRAACQGVAVRHAASGAECCGASGER